MILGEAMEAARPEQIGARVSDVSDQQVPTEAASGRQRRSHAAQGRILAPLFEDRRPDLPHDVLRATLHFGRRRLGVEPQHPVRDLQREADERADREPARQLSGGVTAHPVRDDHQVIDLFDPFGHVAARQAREHRLERARHLRHEELVLVVLAKVPCVRQGAHIDADQR